MLLISASQEPPLTDPTVVSHRQASKQVLGGVWEQIRPAHLPDCSGTRGTGSHCANVKTCTISELGWFTCGRKRDAEGSLYLRNIRERQKAVELGGSC